MVWRKIDERLRRLEGRLGSIARRKWLAILLAGLAPLVVRAMLLPWLPVPTPRVQDEFSHLLVADTFAHGRLVNPVHPMWVHFESMHILVRPVYASIFPVAQGAVLALAQVLTGCPWIGVWLSVGLMCAALCWMLQGWVSPGWAFMGAVLAAARFAIASYWMNSYWGGAVAAAAGALVLGALGRIRKRGRWQDAVVLGIGLVILANSRPYEGALIGLPAVAAAVWWLRGKARPLALLLPLVVVLSVGAASLGYYCSRFNGNPLQLPYSFYRNTMTMAPHFIWQAPRAEPVYHHRVLWWFYAGWEMNSYQDAKANRASRSVQTKAMHYWRFFVGPFLSLPFLTLPWMWRRRRVRCLLMVAGLFFAGLAVEVWDSPHYAAPAMALVILLSVEALRQLRVSLGPYWVRLVFLGCVLTPVLGGSGVRSTGAARAAILDRLEAQGGRHLVLVRCGPAHDVGDEWVYNSADIDSASVVWSREMDPTSNRELLDYFSGRRVWLAQPDTRPVRLSPYDPSMLPDPPFRYVPLGSRAITALRSPDEVRRKILSLVASHYTAPYHFSCDQWSYLFTTVTEVESPDTAHGCFPPGNRGQPVGFDRWFTWLQAQR
jgi:hypothetical protein